VLGLLGNTGNIDAPHLHCHIMDGPSPHARGRGGRATLAPLREHEDWPGGPG
jgi:hypothetical protein